MLKTAFFLLLAGLMTLTLVTPVAAGVLEDAQAKAKAENKPILIDLYAVWCGPCKAFNKASQEDSDVIEVLDRFVLVKIDAEKGDGVAIAKAFQIQGYPTYIATNTEGTTLARWYGFTKKQFMGETADVLDDPTTIEEKQARYQSQPTAEDAAKLAVYHDTRGEYQEALELYRSAQELSRDPEADYSMAIFETTFYGARKDVYTSEQLTASADAVFASAKAEDGDLLLTARMMCSYASGKETPELAIPYIKDSVERTADSKDPEVVESRTKVLPDYALRVENDKEKAITYKKTSMPEGWMDDADMLNSYAWWCFENRLNLDEGYALAQKGVMLAEPGSDKAQILDTMAEVCNAQENCKEAVALMEQAIQEDPDREYYKKQLQRFQELLAQQEGMH